MKVATADLGFQSSHLFAKQERGNETLRTWRGERPDFAALENGRGAGLNTGLNSAIARISDAARQLFATSPQPLPATATSGEAQAIDAAQEAVDNDPFLSMIRQMIQFLTGEEVKVFNMKDFSAEMRQVEVQASATSEKMQATSAGAAGRGAWGMEYDAYRLYEEFEQTSFSAAGTIRTADGQEFNFTFDLQMTRYYREESSVSIRAGNAIRKDPLVVNFGGSAAQLLANTNQRFHFDIDGDGKDDLIPLLASGSGFLALDRNGNGKIDSGKELFGPHSGNGFTDLAELDSDGNGWIDAGDPAFDKLTVWTPTTSATGVSGSLRSLASLGIGALGLAHVATPFALRGENNADLGVIKGSGIYLTETGKIGSLQEIDVTV